MPDPRPDALHARLRTAEMPPRGRAVVSPECAPLAPGYSAMMDALNTATAPRTPTPGRYASGGWLRPAADPVADAFGSGPWREPTYPHRDPHQPAYDEDAYRD